MLLRHVGPALDLELSGRPRWSSSGRRTCPSRSLSLELLLVLGGGDGRPARPPARRPRPDERAAREPPPVSAARPRPAGSARRRHGDAGCCTPAGGREQGTAVKPTATELAFRRVGRGSRTFALRRHGVRPRRSAAPPVPRRRRRFRPVRRPTARADAAIATADRRTPVAACSRSPVVLLVVAGAGRRGRGAVPRHLGAALAGRLRRAASTAAGRGRATSSSSAGRRSPRGSTPTVIAGVRWRGEQLRDGYALGLSGGDHVGRRTTRSSTAARRRRGCSSTASRPAT